MAVSAQETGRELPRNREEYLNSFEKEWSEIHQGEPPVLGLRKEGRPERKEACEDVKLKNREKGLFLVTDGVTTEEGWLASRETARVMYEHLGETLDRAIENNIQEALRARENPLDRITAYVGAQMTAAVEQADARIKAFGADPRFQGSATTLSLAKLVELPDGKGGHLQRMFFTNIGDSRIYIQRKGGELKQMTRDDSLLEHKVDLQEVTPDEARKIDQAPSIGSLPQKLSRIARMRAIITRSVGIGTPTENLGVFFLDLHPGDRLVMVSDGVSDQLLEQTIENSLDGEIDDNRAEAALQQEALEMAENGTDPRAKGDDISALVHTVEEKGPDRAYLHKDQKEVRTGESLKQDLIRLRLGKETARQEVQRIQAELAQLDSLTPKRERLALMIQLEKAKEVESTYSYHLEKSQLDILDEQLVPRFQTGEQVHVWREDFDPPSLDRQMWTVVSYDPQSRAYALRGSGGAVREVSRYELEPVQTGLMVRLGDELPAVNEIGVRERGFKVSAFDKDGTVILAKERNNAIKRLRVPAAEANESFHDQLYAAERSRQRMAQAADSYQEAVKQHQAYKDEAEMVDRVESRQRAFDLAKSGLEETQAIHREIEGYQKILDEHRDLERKQVRGGLTRQEDARRRQLAVWVHGNRATPPLEQLLREKKQELEDLQRKKQG